MGSIMISKDTCGTLFVTNVPRRYFKGSTDKYKLEYQNDKMKQTKQTRHDIIMMSNMKNGNGVFQI